MQSTNEKQVAVVRPFAINYRQMCANCEHWDIIRGMMGFCSWCERQYRSREIIHQPQQLPKVYRRVQPKVRHLKVHHLKVHRPSQVQYSSRMTYLVKKGSGGLHRLQYPWTHHHHHPPDHYPHGWIQLILQHPMRSTCVSGLLMMMILSPTVGS